MTGIAGLPKLFPSLTAIVIAVPCPLLVRVLCWSTFGVIVAHRGKFRAWNVRFSNRPVGVKRFRLSTTAAVDVTGGLALLFGMGTSAPPSFGSWIGVGQLI